MAETKKKNKGGRPTTYKPEYCEQIVEFFSPPYYTIKDMTITKPDGTQIDKTEMEALPPRFLSGFAREIKMSLLSYRSLFKDWADKHEEFANALKIAKDLEIEMVRVNASMGLYPPAISIFTLKNLTNGDGQRWTDRTEVTGGNGEALAFKAVTIVCSGNPARPVNE